MKKLLILGLLLSSSATMAATVYKYLPQSGLITPDVATGYLEISDHLIDRDAKGNTIYCPRSPWLTWEKRLCQNPQGKNQWTYLQQAVPKGKTYVGFEVRHASTIVYWK